MIAELKVITVILYVYLHIYWFITEKRAYKEKPKTQQNSLQRHLERIVTRLFALLLFFALLMHPIFPFHNTYLQILGFFLFLLGFCISISARMALGTNWSHAAEYQVKQKQVLVTEGIYGFIRHPIYTGMILGYIGGFLVAQSYLVVFFLFLLPISATIQAKREEKILTKHFGNEYDAYKQRTKMFLPYLY